MRNEILKASCSPAVEFIVVELHSMRARAFVDSTQQLFTQTGFWHKATLVLQKSIKKKHFAKCFHLYK